MAIGLYHRMNEYGLVPNKFTFPFVFKACSALSSIERERKIHEDVIRSKWEKDVLIDMYANCSCVMCGVLDKCLVRY